MGAITKRIQESIDSLNRGSIENSLIQSCIAIDASAKRRYKGKKPGERIKTFVDDEFIVFMRVYTGFTFIREKGADVVFPWKDGTTIDVKTLVYEFVRCGLLHDGSLDEVLLVENSNRSGSDNGRVIISNNFAWGLILMVVAADVNRDEGPLVRDTLSVKNPKNRKVSLSFNIGTHWGNRKGLMDELDKFDKSR